MRQISGTIVVLATASTLGLGAALAQSGLGSAAQSGVGSAASQTRNAANGIGNAAGNATGLGSPTQASAQDKDFLKNATQGSNFEIEAAQLALQKSSDDGVKKFAQMMIDDHTKLNEQMKPVAAEAGVTPPTGISKKDEKLIAQLKAASGPAFDKRYIDIMVADHSADLKEFKNEASGGQLASEKSAATQATPIVDHHLQEAKALAKSHSTDKPTTGSPSSNG